MVNDIIRQFYEKSNLPALVIETRIAAFNRNSDISEEFEEWITDRTYRTKHAISVEGYTAKKLSEISNYLNGDSAFILLIELRENPDKAHKRIERGFKFK